MLDLVIKFTNLEKVTMKDSTNLMGLRLWSPKYDYKLC